NPPIVLDSAHTPNAVSRLRETLDEYFPEQPIIMIFGVSEDKNAAEMLQLMAPRLEKVILTRAEHPRALKTEEMVRFAEQVGVAYETLEPVEAAVVRALALADERALILSAGSIFVTAAVRAVLSEMKAA
ncbi:MAG: hypothetical protein L3J16_07385, partial [Anaerolineales bacterium]|nr:hypothetical protein [Anaerolineales bacterium]